MKNSQTVEESIAQYTRAWNEKELCDIRAGIENAVMTALPLLMRKIRCFKGIDGISRLLNIITIADGSAGCLFSPVRMIRKVWITLSTTKRTRSFALSGFLVHWHKSLYLW